MSLLLIREHKSQQKIVYFNRYVMLHKLFRVYPAVIKMLHQVATAAKVICIY